MRLSRKWMFTFTATIATLAGIFISAPASGATAGPVTVPSAGVYSGFVASHDASRPMFRNIMSFTVPTTFCYGDSQTPDTTAALWGGLDGASSIPPATLSLIQAGVFLNCHNGKVSDNVFVTLLNGPGKTEFYGVPAIPARSNKIDHIINPIPTPVGPGDKVIVSICGTGLTQPPPLGADTGACAVGPTNAKNFYITFASYHAGQWYNYQHIYQYNGPSAYKETASPGSKSECILERPTLPETVRTPSGKTVSRQLLLTSYAPFSVNCDAITDQLPFGSTLVNFNRPQAGYRSYYLPMYGTFTGRLNSSASASNGPCRSSPVSWTTAVCGAPSAAAADRLACQPTVRHQNKSDVTDR